MRNPEELQNLYGTNVIETRLKALQIAADVFAHISDQPVSVWRGEDAKELEKEGHLRTLKDFRESVDMVFNAAGLGKVGRGNKEFFEHPLSAAGSDCSDYG